MNFRFKSGLMFVFCLAFAFNLFAFDEDIRFQKKDDFFYKLYLDDYSVEMIELLEGRFNELDWEADSEKKQLNLQALKKKLKNVLRKRKRRKSIIHSIFKKLKPETEKEESVVKTVPLEGKIRKIDFKREHILEKLKEKK